MRRMEEDDSGGIATGTQKRGSKQGEALTSACFTLERDREREEEEERKGREAESRRTDWKSESRTKGRNKDKQQGEKSTGRSNA